jgi:hypothetical protein
MIKKVETEVIRHLSSTNVADLVTCSVLAGGTADVISEH